MQYRVAVYNCLQNLNMTIFIAFTLQFFISHRTFKRLTFFCILIANVIKTEGIWWTNIVIRKIDLRIIGVNTAKPLREAGDIIFS